MCSPILGGSAARPWRTPCAWPACGRRTTRSQPGGSTALRPLQSSLVWSFLSPLVSREAPPANLHLFGRRDTQKFQRLRDHALGLHREGEPERLLGRTHDLDVAVERRELL